MSKVKKLSRKEQAQATRQKILDSAMDLVKDYNFKDISVEMITEKAGIAKGSFYVHFKSKNALITELAKNKIEELDIDYDNYFESIPETMTTTDCLLLVSDNIMHHMVELIGHERLCIIYEMLLEGNQEISIITSYSRKIYSLLYKLSKRGIERGEFDKNLDPNTLSKHILIALRGLSYQWCILYPDFDLYSATKTHMSILLNGMTCKKPS